MFYTLIQNQLPDGGWLGERFVCFEADSREEANQRAEWFGIDLGATDENGYNRWEWHRPGLGTTYPKLTDHRLETTYHVGGWVIIFKDDNIKSSMAVTLDSTSIPA